MLNSTYHKIGLMTMNDSYFGLFELQPRTLIIISFLIGYILSDDLNGYELAVLGNFFMLLAQTLVTASAEALLLENKVAEKENAKMKQDIQSLQNQIYELQARFNNK